MYAEYPIFRTRDNAKNSGIERSVRFIHIHVGAYNAATAVPRRIEDFVLWNYDTVRETPKRAVRLIQKISPLDLGKDG